MSFFTLQDLGLAISSDQLLDQWLSYMQTVYPGYTPSASNLEYILAVIFSTWAADVNAQASTGAAELFNQFGQQLMGIQPETGTAATAAVTVLAVDDAGYTLPVGTQFVLDNSFGFYSVVPMTIPQGSTTGTVTLAASANGSQMNGVGAQGGAQLNQQLNWVLAVNLVSPAQGGTDSETQEAYLRRLATELRLMAPRPITGPDYGIFALSFQPAFGTTQQEVGRAAAIDGYDPGTDSYNNERTVTVAVTDAAGDALNDETMNAIQAWFETLREANFVINVVAPNYTPVYVTVSVFRETSFDVESVQENVQSALTTYLDPANWGAPQGAQGVWVNRPTIPYSQIESVVQRAAGVSYVVQGSLLVGLNENPVGVGDILLPGPFPLPTTSGGTTIPLTAVTVVN